MGRYRHAQVHSDESTHALLGFSGSSYRRQRRSRYFVLLNLSTARNLSVITQSQTSHTMSECLRLAYILKFVLVVFVIYLVKLLF